MAELIRLEQYDQLDYPHLHEFLDDTARRDKREVESRLAILMAHQLKWDYQQAKRTPLLAGYYRTAAAGVAAASGERYAPQSH